MIIGDSCEAIESSLKEIVEFKNIEYVTNKDHIQKNIENNT